MGEPYLPDQDPTEPHSDSGETAQLDIESSSSEEDLQNPPIQQYSRKTMRPPPRRRRPLNLMVTKSVSGRTDFLETHLYDSESGSDTHSSNLNDDVTMSDWRENNGGNLEHSLTSAAPQLPPALGDTTQGVEDTEVGSIGKDADAAQLEDSCRISLESAGNDGVSQHSGSPASIYNLTSAVKIVSPPMAGNQPRYDICFEISGFSSIDEALVWLKHGQEYFDNLMKEKGAQATQGQSESLG